jgi:hypothetical protein
MIQPLCGLTRPCLGRRLNRGPQRRRHRPRHRLLQRSNGHNNTFLLHHVQIFSTTLSPFASYSSGASRHSPVGRSRTRVVISSGAADARFWGGGFELRGLCSCLRHASPNWLTLDDYASLAASALVPLSLFSLASPNVLRPLLRGGADVLRCRGTVLVMLATCKRKRCGHPPCVPLLAALAHRAGDVYAPTSHGWATACAG